MNKKTLNTSIIILTFLIIGWIVKDMFSQSTTDDLKGGFIEKATYRNENNTGPVQRIYSVSVKDADKAEFEAYGNLMPHSKYGNTKVYFFREDGAIPTKLHPGDVNFDTIFEKDCIALYEKSAMGNFGVILNPFIQKQKSQ